jgi:type I restriction enzyme S subunit
MMRSSEREIELPQVPQAWTWASLADLKAHEPNAMTDGPFGSNLKTSDYTASGVRVVRLGNIGVGRFVEDDKAFVSEAKYRLLMRHEVLPGDLVIAALAEPVGRACMIPPSLGKAIVKADCVRFKVHPLLSASFVMHYLNSPGGRSRAEQLSHGVGRLRINMGEMRALPVPLASLPEQHRIVAEIEKHFTCLDAAVAALGRVRANLKRYAPPCSKPPARDAWCPPRPS